ncbi:MAG: ATPase, partial [Coprobacillus sp.]|nr:ATPase [Coprobacillus sp.]
MYLGIELGSTRVKGVLIDDDSAEVKSFHTHTWHDKKLVNNIYTYDEQDIHEAILDVVRPLVKDANGEICALGVSGMMHGLVALDKNGELLTNIRTWKSTNAEPAAKELSEAFGINIPERWSIAHLYQAILDDEPFVPYIAHITTIAGYVTYKLTGKFTLGIGDASGVFPVDYKTANYNKKILHEFEDLIEERHLPWKLKNILPKIDICTKYAGHVTPEGSKYLDFLVAPKTPVVPPEGDATTGMVVTNTIKPYHGSISAGTSAFLMLTLPKPLDHVYPIVDYVMSPTDRPVMMIHSNECCSLIDEFVD